MSHRTGSSNEKGDESGTHHTRRGVLKLAALTGATAALADGAAAQDGETIQLGGEVAGWIGEAPASIEGETNPTLQLEPGTEYTVAWENLDGVPHDFVIQDANGENIEGTDVISEEGVVTELTFTASEEMDQYICTIHPTTMVGDIQFGGGTAEPGGLPTDLLLIAGALVAAILSPLAFAVLLFLRRDRAETGAPEPGD